MSAEPISAWHQLVSNRNAQGIDALLADTVVFHSPVLHKPQQGRVLTAMYLAAAFRVLCNESFRYVRELRSGHDAMLEFEVEIDGIQVNGVDLIQWNAEGKITEFKVMLRPLKAVNLLHQKMAAMLQGSQ